MQISEKPIIVEGSLLSPPKVLYGEKQVAVSSLKCFVSPIELFDIGC